MTHSATLSTRRKFLLNSSAVSLAALLPNALDAQSAPLQTQDENPVFAPTPKDASLKFTSAGVHRPFAGNTLICHLPQQSKVRDAAAALGDALRSCSFAHKLGILPSDSYHMTVFPGANDQDRTLYGWPADIPIDAPMSECNRIVQERIASFRMTGHLPIRVRVDVEKTLGPQRVSSLRIVTADEREEANLRNLRDRMAKEIFRFRTPDHATYGFHVSLAYQMKPLTREEAVQHQDILKHHVPAIVAAAPVIELGIPEFCTFDDMFRFEIRALLRT
ncbi:DUF1868 domain-containing protein [Granulicella sp. dw_53]|uniref:DUF1868 domain-containing protein n=1 Tax=Granulicella sp. dw_53 TaxID=2719792 RepID=UPI001BD4E183|nr:DUF1868 domain-containing protein [Granulicella sp. dw_53]